MQDTLENFQMGIGGRGNHEIPYLQTPSALWVDIFSEPTIFVQNWGLDTYFSQAICVFQTHFHGICSKTEESRTSNRRCVPTRQVSSKRPTISTDLAWNWRSSGSNRWQRTWIWSLGRKSKRPRPWGLKRRGGINHGETRMMSWLADVDKICGWVDELEVDRRTLRLCKNPRDIQYLTLGGVAWPVTIHEWHGLRSPSVSISCLVTFSRGGPVVPIPGFGSIIANMCSIPFHLRVGTHGLLQHRYIDQIDTTTLHQTSGRPWNWKTCSWATRGWRQTQVMGSYHVKPKSRIDTEKMEIATERDRSNGRSRNGRCTNL